jgi:hypothetical protein
MAKLVRVLGFLANYKKLTAACGLLDKGYFVDVGWVRSSCENRPCDKDGNPVPWLTTSFLQFLAPRLDSTMHLLEFGSGNSTFYFQKICGSVTSVESNNEWFEKVSKSIDPSVVRIYHRTGADYWGCVDEFEKEFDLVLVDGEERLECARAGLAKLSSRGVVILDNSVRAEYRVIYDLLQGLTFRSIDFFGVAPGSRKFNCTTVFYRDGNCLNL